MHASHNIIINSAMMYLIINLLILYAVRCAALLYVVLMNHEDLQDSNYIPWLHSWWCPTTPLPGIGGGLVGD